MNSDQIVADALAQMIIEAGGLRFEDGHGIVEIPVDQVAVNDRGDGVIIPALEFTLENGDSYIVTIIRIPGTIRKTDS